MQMRAGLLPQKEKKIPYLINMKGLTKLQKSKPFKLKAGVVFPNFPDYSRGTGKGSSAPGPAVTPPKGSPEHPTLVAIKPDHFKAHFGALGVVPSA